MTPFWEAVVRAFLSRTQLGAGSLEYATALADMERHREPKIHGQRHIAEAGAPDHIPEPRKPLSPPTSAGQLLRRDGWPSAYRCGRCNRIDHNKRTCTYSDWVYRDGTPYRLAGASLTP